MLRKAKITDVEAIHALITHYANQNLMLARSRALIYEGIREFTLAEENGEIIGVGSLHIIWEDLAEIRALAVREDWRKRGIGRTLVESFLAEARDLQIPQVFTLTYQAGFFAKCGFKAKAKEDMPQKVWRECINCPQFPNCEEEALIIQV